MITPAEFEDKMKDIEYRLENRVDGYYEEDAHIDADAVMCKVLKDLGYTKGVEIFERMPKWYS